MQISPTKKGYQAISNSAEKQLLMKTAFSRNHHFYGSGGSIDADFQPTGGKAIGPQQKSAFTPLANFELSPPNFPYASASAAAVAANFQDNLLRHAAPFYGLPMPVQLQNTSAAAPVSMATDPHQKQNHPLLPHHNHMAALMWSGRQTILPSFQLPLQKSPSCKGSVTTTTNGHQQGFVATNGQHASVTTKGQQELVNNGQQATIGNGQESAVSDNGHSPSINNGGGPLNFSMTALLEAGRISNSNGGGSANSD